MSVITCLPHRHYKLVCAPNHLPRTRNSNYLLPIPRKVGSMWFVDAHRSTLNTCTSHMATLSSQERKGFGVLSIVTRYLYALCWESDEATLANRLVRTRFLFSCTPRKVYVLYDHWLTTIISCAFSFVPSSLGVLTCLPKGSFGKDTTISQPNWKLSAKNYQG